MFVLSEIHLPTLLILLHMELLKAMAVCVPICLLNLCSVTVGEWMSWLDLKTEVDYV